ncbi:MAG: hypothetical protein E6G22_06300 [Actinobacteria bacterium]|nr:MAG: hypothetical protein E6G42_07705 [Actinomycetota bacterium]TML63403.1 MAG: hypothetical protein E6G22_06300 [Actinomycetota bacterium]
MAAAAPDRIPSGRRAVLLLEHCAALDHRDDAHPRGFARLEEVVGGRMARLLVGALVGDHRLSPRDLVG